MKSNETSVNYFILASTFPDSTFMALVLTAQIKKITLILGYLRVSKWY